MAPRITLFVSIDTEEDNWRPARNGLTVENIRELPRLESFFERLGIRATYLTTYQVAARPWAAEILREIHAAGHSEVGAHLHPWNTPPTDEPLVPGNTMLNNLPYELQATKLERLTELLSAALGVRPTSFRAGRHALSRETVRSLIRCGYRVDCSITPYVNWESHDGGPNFIGAPLSCYSLDGQSDVRVPAAAGEVQEVPMSVGYSRRPFGLWSRIHRALAVRALRPVRLLGLARRLGVIKVIALSPELWSADDMLLLSRHLIDEGLGHVQLSFHSPSLRAGLTPYAQTPAAVEGIYTAIETYLEGLAGMARVEFATLRDVHTLLGGTSPSARQDSAEEEAH